MRSTTVGAAVVRRALTCSVVLALGSALVVAPAPSYDPWAWALWGRELTGAGLSTVDGPVFKPLAVAACAVLTPLFGAATPWVWVVVARAGAVLAIWLSFRLGRRLSAGSALAGVLAGVGVALTGPYLDHASSGVSEGLLLALALAGVEAWHAGRPRWAVLCAVGCALLRVETWPFLLAAGLVAWPRLARADRMLLVLAAVAVPAAWFVPELVGSGRLLRAADRARTPNPGQPALAAFPAWASLRAALALPLAPVWVGVAILAASARRRRSVGSVPGLVPVIVGCAWMAIVAAMCQLGFSGEPRYALPGAALVAVGGAVGLALVARDPRAARTATALAVGALVVAAWPRVAELPEVRRFQAHQWALQDDLADAITAVGGRNEVLACGRPYVGPLRGPLLAYRLGVAKHVVEPDLPPAPPGMVFRSRFTGGDPAAPTAPPGFGLRVEHGTWEVSSAC